MFITQEEATPKVKTALRKLLANNDLCDKTSKFGEEKFNLPSGRLADYYTERLNVAEAKPEVFWYLVNIADFINGNHKLVDKVYTEQEKEFYKSLRFKIAKAHFPLRIPCYRVADDQWIGPTDAKFFMDLRGSQLINYNTNTQRLMTQRIVHGNVTYQITVNKAEVAEIRQAFQDSTFIPNVITLGIPENEYDFSYNEEKKELIIKSLDHFDIVDGYHRYLAMSGEYDANENFNYPMELRIVHFSETKSKLMVWQEGQGEDMTEVDNDTMNPNLISNKIVEAMNIDPLFCWNGQISRRGGLVEYGELAEVIRGYYITRQLTSKKEENALVFGLPKEIDPKINVAVGADSRLLTDHVDFIDLMIIFNCITKYEGKEIAEHCKIGLSNRAKLDSKKYSFRRCRRGLMNEISTICEGS